MEMFTFIGLLFSIFGATYGAVSALNSHFGEKITNWNSTAEVIVNGIPEEAVSSRKQAVLWKAAMSVMTRAWYWSQSVPIILFSASAFGLASYLCWKVDYSVGCGKIDVGGQRWVLNSLKAYVIANAICFGVAIIAKFVIQLFNWLLNNVDEAYKEKRPKEIE